MKEASPKRADTVGVHLEERPRAITFTGTESTQVGGGDLVLLGKSCRLERWAVGMAAQHYERP